MVKEESRLTLAQQKLVEKHMELVGKVITKYISFNHSNPDMEWGDLYQTGCLALCKAALSYDKDRPFAPYAISSIRNALTDYCRTANQQHHRSLDEPISEDSTMKDFLAANLEEDTAYQLLCASETMDYLKERQQQCSGVVQKGISCLIWKVQGFSSAELSSHFGASSNSIRAWMSHAAKKLRAEQKLYDLLS
ncbi:MAG: sigma-70 family RNA polymerase sigma factor [Eubacteriales bacterium]|nr:sigma-70 family RNA polymerase sigma factor [Eubacteriales bacterium]